MDDEPTLEHVTHAGAVLAIIVRASFAADGLRFFTPDEFTQQLAYMHHPAGHIIQPHRHNVIERNITETLEVLIIRRGRLRVDFYDEARLLLESRVLHPGDTILLTSGGHGFQALDDLEMLEVKQGPYAGLEDKIRFVSATTEDPSDA